uniref:Uncharacterized protein n=1 Tax=Anguilla anguilla TaxID=7936 RepID=A0A0E9U2B7_ANGAN
MSLPEYELPQEC